MPRNLTADMLARLQSQEFPPVIFAYGEFVSGDFRIWSGPADRVWNGYTWNGVGALVSVEFPQEKGDLEADNFRITLSGIKNSVIELALNECVQGNPVEVWLGSMNDDGSILVDPTLAAAGRMDVPTITDGAETSTIQITCESMLVDLRTPRYGRYTHEDQQIRYPGDNGFKFVASIQDWNRKW